MRPLVLISLALFAVACDCGGGTLVTSPDHKPTPGPQGTTPPPPAMTTPAGWCGSDCDCATGTRCVNIGGELTGNVCDTGPNTCDRPCAVTCGAGTTCQQGVCVTSPCVMASCQMTMMPPGGVTVAGTYRTFYELDVHEF